MKKLCSHKQRNRRQGGRNYCSLVVLSLICFFSGLCIPVSYWLYINILKAVDDSWDFSCHTFWSDLSNFHLYLLLPSFQNVDSRIFQILIIVSQQWEERTMTSVLSNMMSIVASYLSHKHSCCSIHENACVPEHISQYTVERSLIFFIREGHVEGTSKDSQIFVRDGKFVIPCLKIVR